MAKVMVVPEGSRFKVLVNFIQHGATYSTEKIAQHEADKLIEQQHNTANCPDYKVSLRLNK